MKSLTMKSLTMKSLAMKSLAMKPLAMKPLNTPPILALLAVAAPVSRGARPPSGAIGCAPRPT